MALSIYPKDKLIEDGFSISVMWCVVLPLIDMQLKVSNIYFLDICLYFYADINLFIRVILDSRILLVIKHLHLLSWLFLKAVTSEEIKYLVLAI